MSMQNPMTIPARTSLLFALPVMVGCTLGLSQTAHATLIITEDVSGVSITCVDNNAACDSNPAVGTISLGTTSVPVTVNGVEILGSVTVSTGTTRTPGAALLRSSSLSITNISGFSRVLTAVFSDTDFIGPKSAFSATGSGTFESNPTGFLTAKYFDDPSNHQGGTTSSDTPGDLIDSFTHVVPGTVLDSFSHNTAGSLADPDSGLFSMSEQFIISLEAGASLISRGQAENKILAPEPAGVAVLGMGILGLALTRRRRG